MSIHCYTLHKSIPGITHNKMASAYISQDPDDTQALDTPNNKITMTEPIDPIQKPSSQGLIKQDESSLPGYTSFEPGTSLFLPEFPLIDTVLSPEESKNNVHSSTIPNKTPINSVVNGPSHFQNTMGKPVLRQSKGPRSNSGCYICRLRHLKCDERRPLCKRCSTINASCEWPQDNKPKPRYLTNEQARSQKLNEIQSKRRISSSHSHSGTE